MNDIVVKDQSSMGLVPVKEIRARTAAIKELISGAMVENVDFGLIPGTQKKSLYKAGAEKICAMFRIADRYEVEDLSRHGETTYRIKCVGISASGEVLGEGLGECSSREEKYAWRRAVCDEEYELTPETHRRVKFAYGQNRTTYKVYQVRTNPADVANTVLKMAAKRAKMAMVLSVTACSDDFTQDVVEEDDPRPPVDDSPPVDRSPRSRSKAAAPAAGKDDLTGERAWITNRVKDMGKDLAQVLQEGGVASLDELTREAFDKIKAALLRPA